MISPILHLMWIVIAFVILRLYVLKARRLDAALEEIEDRGLVIDEFLKQIDALESRCVTLKEMNLMEQKDPREMISGFLGIEISDLGIDTVTGEDGSCFQVYREHVRIEACGTEESNYDCERYVDVRVEEFELIGGMLHQRLELVRPKMLEAIYGILHSSYGPKDVPCDE